VKGILDDVERVGRTCTLASRERGEPAGMVARQARDPVTTQTLHAR
jgi:hypothetical protein